MRKKWLVGVILTLALVFVAVAPALATEVGGFQIPDQSPTGPDRYVADFGNVFTPAEKAQLVELAQSINKSTSVEVLFLTVNLEDPSMINQVAPMVGSKWGVGKKSQHNGIVVAAAARPGDFLSTSSSRKRKVFIASGYGISPLLSDSELTQLGVTSMQPLTKQNQWFAAFKAGGEELKTRLEAAKAPQTSASNNSAPQTNNDTSGSSVVWVVLLVLILGAGAVAFFVIRKKEREAAEAAEAARLDEEARRARAAAATRAHVAEPTAPKPQKTPPRTFVPAPVPVPVHPKAHTEHKDDDAERRRRQEEEDRRRRREEEEREEEDRRRRDDTFTTGAILGGFGSSDGGSSGGFDSGFGGGGGGGIDFGDSGGFSGGDFGASGGGFDA